MDLNLIKKDISKKVSKTYKVASEKSSKLIEEAKLKLQISSTKDNITEKLNEIGALVYEDYKAGSGSYTDFEDLCKEIEISENSISEMRSKILKMKKMKQCDVCETAIALDDKYCAKCGAEQPIIPKEDEFEDSDVEIFCVGCATKLNKNATFCSSCGAKVEKNSNL